MSLASLFGGLALANAGLGAAHGFKREVEDAGIVQDLPASERFFADYAHRQAEFFIVQDLDELAQQPDLGQFLAADYPEAREIVQTIFTWIGSADFQVPLGLRLDPARKSYWIMREPPGPADRHVSRRAAASGMSSPVHGQSCR